MGFGYCSVLVLLCFVFVFRVVRATFAFWFVFGVVIFGGECGLVWLGFLVYCF